MTIDNTALLSELLGTNAIEMRAGALLDSDPEPLSDALSFDRVEGMLLGLAIGDALGKMSEAMLPNDRRRSYGEIDDYVPVRFTNDRRIGLPSDDTQLAFWTLEQMLVDGGVSSPSASRTGSPGKGSMDWVPRCAPSWESQARDAVARGRRRLGRQRRGHEDRSGRSSLPPAAVARALGRRGLVRHDHAQRLSVDRLVRRNRADDLVRVSFDGPPDPMWWPEVFVATARDLENGTAYSPRGRDFLDYSGPLSSFVE